ncbi:MAG: DNA replication/repair protein RecF [Bacteroidia bacterium]
MQLRSLKAEYFKNYDTVNLQFCEGINCFAGSNGAGKTNLLDAVYVLCNGKSYFNLTDQQLIKAGEMYFSVRGNFLRLGEEEDILCALMRGKKKGIKRNDISYEKLVQHYGEFPAVIVAPGDIELIIAGGEERRRFLDSTLSLLDRDYLLNLMRYDKILQQRNAELKNLNQQEAPQKSLLEVYDDMLVPLAQEIYQKRRLFMDDFLPFFHDIHKYISQENETVQLVYESELHHNSLADLLDKNFRRDVYLQRTTSGTHKDDLVFLLNDTPLKKFGSQGQQKTFLLSLKMAQYQYVANRKGFPPLLLLDDVCERLDEQRLQTLFSLIQQPGFGQVFVTDSSLTRLQSYLGTGNQNVCYFMVDKGKASAI